MRVCDVAVVERAVVDIETNGGVIAVKVVRAQEAIILTVKSASNCTTKLVLRFVIEALYLKL